MHKKRYTIIYIKQQRFSNKYMQNIIRFKRHCDVENLNLFIVAYNNINRNFQNYINKLNNRIEIDDFVRNSKKNIMILIQQLIMKILKKKFINETFIILNENHLINNNNNINVFNIINFNKIVSIS